MSRFSTWWAFGYTLGKPRWKESLSAKSENRIRDFMNSRYLLCRNLGIIRMEKINGWRQLKRFDWWRKNKITDFCIYSCYCYFDYQCFIGKGYIEFHRTGKIWFLNKIKSSLFIQIMNCIVSKYCDNTFNSVPRSRWLVCHWWAHCWGIQYSDSQCDSIPSALCIWGWLDLIENTLKMVWTSGRKMNS